jgi:hypothetical protein
MWAGNIGGICESYIAGEAMRVRRLGLKVVDAMLVGL